MARPVTLFTGQWADLPLADLAAKGIEILGRQDEDYGRFAWILDPDGIKVELWQQVGGAPE